MRSGPGTSSANHPAQPAEVVVTFVDAVNRQDWPMVEALVAPTFVRHSDAGGDIDGRDELVAFLQGEYTTFPDAHEELESVIADGNLVAARHVFTGTQDGPLRHHPGTGRRIRARYLAMYRVTEGRIHEAWAEWDNLSGHTQLGLIDG
jgi:steroid delta-isomerase-like uncharacterized protein